jgi:hypothetical protein
LHVQTPPKSSYLIRPSGTFSPHPPFGHLLLEEKEIGILYFIEKEIGIFSYFEGLEDIDGFEVRAQRNYFLFSIFPFSNPALTLTGSSNSVRFPISIFSISHFPDQQSTVFPYLCTGDNLFYRIPACPRVRKVRTTQSAILPNGKVLRLNTVGTASATEKIPSRLRAR